MRMSPIAPTSVITAPSTTNLAAHQKLGESNRPGEPQHRDDERCLEEDRPARLDTVCQKQQHAREIQGIETQDPILCTGAAKCPIGGASHRDAKQDLRGSDCQRKDERGHSKMSISSFS
jgi:hypothetical protein